MHPAALIAGLVSAYLWSVVIQRLSTPQAAFVTALAVIWCVMFGWTATRRP